VNLVGSTNPFPMSSESERCTAARTARFYLVFTVAITARLLSSLPFQAEIQARAAFPRSSAAMAAIAHLVQRPVPWVNHPGVLGSLRPQEAHFI
jgi:hypothetical protein